MTIFVGFMGNKGGIAKSSLARNVAEGCARAGLRVVAIDTDPQFTLTYTMQVEPMDSLTALLTDEEAEWRDLLVPVPEDFSGCAHEFFYLLPTYEGQAQIESLPGLPERMYERFQELRGYADVVIVDASPGRNNVHAGLYQTLDYVILPCQPELESIMGLAATLNHLYTIGQTAPVAQVLGIAPNQLIASQTTHQINYGFILEQYRNHYPVFKPIRDMAIWRDAVQVRRSIYRLMDSKLYNERQKARVAVAELQPVVDAIVKAARA